MSRYYSNVRALASLGGGGGQLPLRAMKTIAGASSIHNSHKINYVLFMVCTIWNTATYSYNYISSQL